MDSRYTAPSHAPSMDNGLGTLGEVVPELRTKLQELVDTDRSGPRAGREHGQSSGSSPLRNVLMAVGCLAALGFMLRR